MKKIDPAISSVKDRFITTQVPNLFVERSLNWKGFTVMWLNGLTWRELISDWFANCFTYFLSKIIYSEFSAQSMIKKFFIDNHHRTIYGPIRREVSAVPAGWNYQIEWKCPFFCETRILPITNLTLTYHNLKLYWVCELLLILCTPWTLTWLCSGWGRLFQGQLQLSLRLR